MKNIELYHRKLSKTRNVAFLFAWFPSTVQFSPMLSNTVFLQKYLHKSQENSQAEIAPASTNTSALRSGS